MKRFRYRLESLLHLKDKQASDKLVIYAEKIRHRRQVEIEIEDNKNLLQRVHRDIEELRSQVFSPGAQSYYIAEVQRLKKLGQELQKKLSEKVKDESQARDVYLKSRSEKEMLVRLKDRKRQQFFKDQLKLEQKLLDDVIQSRINHLI